ncbi:hypothetical protein OHD62_27035 [Mesorhizobium sp. YC-39]|uniref:hypothetical protein n=1 Tax=unclassified Mesorhizobium TaxID=325217 RepID=UPI0021E7F79D|nr:MULTISPECIES: hypothetical protein [unclassified Mesorhizobium]MCV3208607.1 hypothetical protein [Mesorhizobium sp. YC-2]MCV3232044.1 hypothetical protein [Mesorhizobium sp. YC-39]
MVTDPKAALQKLSARGITTLEQFAESKAHMRKPRRIDSEKALEEIFARSAVSSDSSVKSKIGPPSSSVSIVLDGKRVEYNEIARLDGQPLDYVATTLKGGDQALVVFSDRSILKADLLRQFKAPLQAINKEVENALMAGGLQPSPLAPRIDLGLRIWVDINYTDSSWTFAPEEYVNDLTQFDAGLGWFEGDWNDKISSVQMGRCYCIAWADINQQGDRLILYEDTPNLHIFGWGDAISAIYAPFRS